MVDCNDNRRADIVRQQPSRDLSSRELVVKVLPVAQS